MEAVFCEACQEEAATVVLESTEAAKEEPLSGFLWRDMTEGLNKQNDNPAEGVEEVQDTSAGASISTHNTRILTYRDNKSTRDRESCDVHTQQATSHNLN